MWLTVLLACGGPTSTTPTSTTASLLPTALVAFDDDGWVRIFDGTDVWPIVEGDRPAWSPNGRRVAYVYEQAIHVTDGIQVTRLTSGDFDDDKPVWSPDGLHIAFTRDYGKSQELWTMRADGTGATPATALGGWVNDPDWESEGLVFQDEAENPWIMYVMSAPGAKPEPLFDVSDRIFENDADWSPDGSLLFSAFEDVNNEEIYRIAAPDEPRVKLTVNAASDDEASMSPDGSRILFESDRGGIYDIWMMDLSGDGVERLIAPSPIAGRQHAAWRP